MSKLDSERIRVIIMDCLFTDKEAKDKEQTDKAVLAHGITTNIGFHPERLEGHRQEIEEMLTELPDEFMKSSGGGMTFLNACNDRHGEQWTGLHKTMEELFLLGMGLGRVECPMPRYLWDALPGGVPYYVVDDTGLEREQTNAD
jgi:hypothetical protein